MPELNKIQHQFWSNFHCRLIITQGSRGKTKIIIIKKIGKYQGKNVATIRGKPSSSVFCWCHFKSQVWTHKNTCCLLKHRNQISKMWLGSLLKDWVTPYNWLFLRTVFLKLSTQKKLSLESDLLYVHRNTNIPQGMLARLLWRQITKNQIHKIKWLSYEGLEK